MIDWAAQLDVHYAKIMYLLELPRMGDCWVICWRNMVVNVIVELRYRLHEIKKKLCIDQIRKHRVCY